MMKVSKKIAVSFSILSFLLLLALMKNIFLSPSFNEVSGSLESSSCEVNYRGDSLELQIKNENGMLESYNTVGVGCVHFSSMLGIKGQDVSIKFSPNTRIIKYLNVDGKVFISEVGSNVRGWIGIFILFLLSFGISLALWKHKS
jgi:hypothetical protein